MIEDPDKDLEDNSLTEYLTIEMPLKSKTKAEVKAISEGKLEFFDHGRNAGPGLGIRKQIFSYLWQESENIIKDIRAEIDENAITQLINYINNDSQYLSLFSLIPTAVVLGPSDQYEFYAAFQARALHCNIRIARLDVLESASLKDCIKTILSQLIADDDELNGASVENADGAALENVTKEKEDGIFCVFDIERLVQFRKREVEIRKRDKKPVAKLVILIPQLELFPVQVLERLLKILAGRKELNISLVAGSSTNLENIRQGIPMASFARMDTCVFQLKQSKECLDKIVTNLFLNRPSDLKLGHRPFEALYDRFHGRDLSISAFTLGIKYAYMAHFYGNPLSVFLYPDLEFEMIQKEHAHFSHIRSLKSFRVFIEDGLEDIGYEDAQASEFKMLLEDDEFLYDWTKDKVDSIFQHSSRFAVAIKALLAMQDLFQAKALKKPVRSLYNLGIKDALVTDNHIPTCVSLFSLQSNARKRKYLADLVETLENERLEDDKAIIEALLHTLPEEAPPESSDSATEDEEFVAIVEENRKRSLVTELNMVKKRRRTQSAKKAGTVVSLDDDRTRARIRKDLMAYFKSALKSYKTLPLHEIVYFEDSGNLISKTFHTEYRGIIENGLKYPKQYLGCNECTNEMSSHLPDISVLFKLYLECGRLINLQDWLDAFKSIVDENDAAEEDEELEKRLQARFSRGVEELKFMGFIRHTGRKTDHVMKTIGKGKAIRLKYCKAAGIVMHLMHRDLLGGENMADIGACKVLCIGRPKETMENLN